MNGDIIYKDWLGRKVLERGDYKIVVGRFLRDMFCMGWRGYKKVNGNWMYVTTYSLSVIPTLDRFIRQLDFEFNLPDFKYQLKKTYNDPFTESK